jgi:hypothetical protein
LLKQCERHLEEQRTNSGGLAVLRFIGAGPMHGAVHDEAFMEDLFGALTDGEEHRYDFVWPVKYRSETVPDWDRNQLKSENHFIGDLLRLIDEEDHEEAFAPLLENRKARQYAESIVSEQEEIVREAENLLLTRLLGKGGSR